MLNENMIKALQTVALLDSELHEAYKCTCKNGAQTNEDMALHYALYDLLAEVSTLTNKISRLTIK